MRRNSIVISPTLGSKAVLDLAHEGHQGIVKTKQLIRDKVWFPRIDKMAEEKVKNLTVFHVKLQRPNHHQNLSE